MIYLSIKLYNFSGSGITIGDMTLTPLVEEEDRDRVPPDAPRTRQTDGFALGCLVYEVVAGLGLLRGGLMMEIGTRSGMVVMSLGGFRSWMG